MTHPDKRPYGPKRHRDGQPDLHGLDELHRRLVKAVCAGEVAFFQKTDVLDADVLAALITGRSYKGRAPWPLASKGVRITGGRVETRLDLSHARIGWPLALFGTYLTEGVELTRAQTRGLLFDSCKIKNFHLPGTQVTGQFSAEKAEFNMPKGKALWSQGAEITGGMFLNNAKVNGECDINNAKIGGQFNANDATFNNPNDIALRAQGAEIRADVFLNNATVNGECDITGAKVGGPFSALDAEFITPDGTALRAQDAQVTGPVFLSKATLKGVCDFNSAQTAEILLTYSTLTGVFRGDYGAKIKRLDLRGAKLFSARNAQFETTHSETADPEDEPASPADPRVLDLTDARIGRLDMPQLSQDQIKGIVVLTRCHVEHFCDHKRGWPDALEREGNAWVTPQSRRDPETGEDIGYYDLNGFTYDYLSVPNGGSADGAEESTAQARKRWLLSQHAHDIADQFKPQPWRQMAARLEAQGHDDAARKIALFRRQSHRQSKAVTGWRVAFSWLLDILSDYGFNPWKTLGWSVGVIAVWAAFYGLMAWTGPMPDGGYSPLAGYTAAGPASDANANPPPVFIRAEADDVTAATNINDLAQAGPFLSRVYPDFNPLLYSLDVFVPVLDLGMDRYWRPNPNHVAQDRYHLALNFWLMVDRQLPILRWVSPQSIHPLSQTWVWMTGSFLYWLTILQRFLGAILIAIMVTSFTGLLTREDKLS